MPRRPSPAEITTAWEHTRLPTRRPQLHTELQPPRQYGDPGTDPLGTNRWAHPHDAYPWVKTGYDRWIHIGGYAIRTDRQVGTYQPGQERRTTPRRAR
jgi:hypothetical protein